MPSIYRLFLNPFSESITLIKPLLSGRYWARCQGHEENKKQRLFKGSGKHKNCSDLLYTDNNILICNPSDHRPVALQLLLKMHIPEPSSESQASRECVLKRSPGDSNAQPGLRMQQLRFQLPQMENGNKL